MSHYAAETTHDQLRLISGLLKRSSGESLARGKTMRGSTERNRLEIFTDMHVWTGIRKVIEQINANAMV